MLPVGIPDERDRATDGDLVRRCRDGDRDDFRFLIRRYQRAVVAHLRGRLRAGDPIDDAAQETFVRAYANLRALRSPDAFGSWVIGIADRVAREAWRRRGREQDAAAVVLEEARTSRRTVSGGYVPDVESAVAALPARLREVVLLRFYAEQSCAEISRALHVPIGTVTKRLSRAYVSIRASLERSEVPS